MQALKEDDIEELRNVVGELDRVRIGSAGEDEMMASANILRS
jgi:molecular chaperone DnaK